MSPPRASAAACCSTSRSTSRKRVMLRSRRKSTMALVGRRLRASLEDKVERRFRGTAETREAGVRNELPDRGLAGLCAEGVAARLGQGVRDAQQGGAVVVDAADGIEVVGDRVAGVGLDDEPGAVGGKRLTDVAGGSERVAHVVQAVECRGEVVTGAGELAGPGDLEAHPAGDPGVGGPLAGDLNRPVVIVRAGE